MGICSKCENEFVCYMYEENKDKCQWLYSSKLSKEYKEYCSGCESRGEIPNGYCEWILRKEER